jgi:hypothetical protein
MVSLTFSLKEAGSAGDYGGRSEKSTSRVLIKTPLKGSGYREKYGTRFNAR